MASCARISYIHSHRIRRDWTMYDTMRHHFITLPMANDILTTVETFCSCLLDEPQINHKLILQLFLSAGELELMAVGILRSLPKLIFLVGQQVAFITKWYSKLTCPNLTWNIPSSHLATMFFGNWILLYGTSYYELTYNGLQFVSKFSKSLCLFLGDKKLTTTPAIRKQVVR